MNSSGFPRIRRLPGQAIGIRFARVIAYECLEFVFHRRPPGGVVACLWLWPIRNPDLALREVFKVRLDCSDRIERVTPAVDDEQRLVAKVARKQVAIDVKVVVVQDADESIEGKKRGVRRGVAHGQRTCRSRHPIRRRRRRDSRRRCRCASPCRGSRAGFRSCALLHHGTSLHEAGST